jgi:hypothetical protein
MCQFSLVCGQTFAYDAVCYDATKGFVWICSTQLAIVFFAMMIVTLRVACYEIQDEEDFIKQRNWCVRLFCCCTGKKDEKPPQEGPPGAAEVPRREDSFAKTKRNG